jgi:membrane protein
VTLSFTIATIAFLLVALSSIIALPVALNYLPLPGVTTLLLEIGRWPILLLLVTLGLTLIYRYVRAVRNRDGNGSPGAVPLPLFVWLAASTLFSWYAANFGSFNKTYGSLGAVIGFMTWVWLSIIVVLIGAKFNVAWSGNRNECIHGDDSMKGLRR